MCDLVYAQMNLIHIFKSSSPYSCWSIIVTPYNLPPEMCMTKPYMFLSCVVPSPFNPMVGTDVYLQPLIDDLNKLWNGVLTMFQESQIS